MSVASNINNIANFITVSSAGEMTNVTQPAFLAVLSSGTDDNVTGNSTTYTLGTNTAFTEIFDQNADFTTSPCTFTAPVSGRFQLNASSRLINTVLCITMNLTVVTSNRSYSSTLNRPAMSGTLFQVWNNVLVDMDAADTVTWTILAAGEAGDTLDLSNTSNSNVVSGFLAC